MTLIMENLKRFGLRLRVSFLVVATVTSFGHAQSDWPVYNGGLDGDHYYNPFHRFIDWVEKEDTADNSLADRFTLDRILLLETGTRPIASYGLVFFFRSIHPKAGHSQDASPFQTGNRRKKKKKKPHAGTDTETVPPPIQAREKERKKRKRHDTGKERKKDRT